MTVLQALYGGQYAELAKKGYDTNKGRLYGNLLFAAVIMIYIFLIIIVLNFFSEDFSRDFSRLMRDIFGRTAGKTIGKIIAIPLIAIIYLVVALVFGSKKRYEKSYEVYSKATKKEKESALAKMIIIFVIGLGGLFVLSIASLFV